MGELVTNVRSIGKQSLTPRFILESIANDVDDLESIVVIAFPKGMNISDFRAWVSGDMSHLPAAAFCVQSLALSYANDLLEEGEGEET